MGSRTNLSCAAWSWALVGFQGVGNVRFNGRSPWRVVCRRSEGREHSTTGLEVDEIDGTMQGCLMAGECRQRAATGIVQPSNAASNGWRERRDRVRLAMSAGERPSVQLHVERRRQPLPNGGNGRAAPSIDGRNGRRTRIAVRQNPRLTARAAAHGPSTSSCKSLNRTSIAGPEWICRAKMPRRAMSGSFRITQGWPLMKVFTSGPLAVIS